MAVAPALGSDLPVARRAPSRSVAAGLDARLRALAREEAPLRRAMAALAGRWVEIRGWERLGYARLRDYAAERLGLSARSLQDFAAVDRALCELPELERALVVGELAWTKVRLLARVATAGDESRWIEFARARTVRSLEREVRRVDLGALESHGVEIDPEGEDEGEKEFKEGIRIRCTPAVRGRWWRVRQVANRVAGERLPVWAAMEHVAAEVASALPLEAPEDGEPFAAAVAVVHRRRLRRRVANACAAQGAGTVSSGLCGAKLPPFARSLVEGLSEADAFELDARLRRAVARGQRLDAELSAGLLEVAEGRCHRGWGFPDFAHYVRERLGMSPRRARALLRLERAGRRCPDLMGAYRAGQLSWVQAHALVPVALLGGAPHEAWIGFAQRVSVRRLEDEVGSALARCEIGASAFPGPPASAFPEPPGGAEPGGEVDPQADSQLDPQPDSQAGSQPDSQSGWQSGWQTRAQPREPETTPEEDSRPFFSAPRAVARFFRAVLCSTRRYLERCTGQLPTEGQAFGWMLEHALAVWENSEGGESDDPSRRRMQRAHAVFARDGWRCTVPGCTSYRNLHDHHIRFRSAGGSNALENRTTLCAAHHQRGVHAGLVRCSGKAPAKLRFELGLREGRPPLVAYRSGDVISEGGASRNAILEDAMT